MCCKFGKNANKMHWLLYALILLHHVYLLTVTDFLFQLLVSIKYSLKYESFLHKHASMSSAPCTLGMSHCATYLAGNTSFIGWDLWPPNNPNLKLVYYKSCGIIQQRVYQSCLSVHNVDELKQLFLNVWLGTDHSIIDNELHKQWDHVWSCMQANCGHMSNWCDSVNIHSAIQHVMSHFCHTQYNFWIVIFVILVTSLDFFSS